MGTEIRLTDDQAAELESMLSEVLGDLSSEIAGTENPSYRHALNRRRDLLREVRALLRLP
jgi:hypothetical protein